jgi:valyl-tRNA synthetase
MNIYKLIWDDFCSWYLEMVKPVYGQPLNESTYQQTISFFDELMRLLHPFMPFISEEIWHSIKERKAGESICVASYPFSQNQAGEKLDKVLLCISKIRELRNSKGLSPKETFAIAIKTNDKQSYEPYGLILSKLANVSAITYTEIAPEGTILIPVDTDEVFAYLTIQLDAEAEKEKITKEIDYLEGFAKSVDAKLSNEKFVANAKAELVEKEKQKKADALMKIEVLKRSLESL